MNTNMHITRDQARGLLQAVRFAQEAGGGDNLLDLPPLETLYGYEHMLMAALERIADLERRRLTTRRVA